LKQLRQQSVIWSEEPRREGQRDNQEEVPAMEKAKLEKKVDGSKELKVIGAGLSRTGTLSTRAALEELLGGACYHGVVPVVERVTVSPVLSLLSYTISPIIVTVSPSHKNFIFSPRESTFLCGVLPSPAAS